MPSNATNRTGCIIRQSNAFYIDLDQQIRDLRRQRSVIADQIDSRLVRDRRFTNKDYWATRYAVGKTKVSGYWRSRFTALRVGQIRHL